MVDPSKFELYHFPLIDRTLFGLTVLVFEDGHFACEAIRLQSARRHLQVYRPSVVIVDIGLPYGNGTELIEEVHVPPRGCRWFWPPLATALAKQWRLLRARMVFLPNR